jgi:DNA mismatch repair protein MutL
MIKVLPGHISNLIAAGEVVQRPASVVKELVENSVDAGAENIHVIIKDSGRTLIQVIDDGCGFSAEDATRAFLRHATSKITTAEDLNSIKTFGFRGEALASICSVAEVTLRTRREEDETGTEVKYAESKLMSQNTTSTPSGSNLLVRNLFYNVPARRKFLKTDATEFRQIVSEFSRIAITRPHLSFRLTHNNSDIYLLSPAPLKKRIQDIAGKDMSKELVEVSVDTSLIKIRGFIGKPEYSKKSAGNQYLFANNRYFRSSYFTKAILKGYNGLIQEGHLPSFFIFFECDPQKTDVNIHPAKTEIKFEDDYAIYDILHSATRESLGKNSFMPSIDFDMDGAPEIPKIRTNFYVPPPKMDFDPLFNPFKESIDVEEIDKRYHSPYTEMPDSDSLFSDSGIPQKPVLQIAGKYIITTIKTGAIIIDIRRARERVLYERYLNALTRGETLSRQSLFPLTTTIDKQSLSILQENETTLRFMGFDITVEDDSVTVKGLPEGFNDDSDSLGAIIDGLVCELSEDGRDFGKISRERMARQLARSGSSGKSEPLNNLEAQTLIDTLFACSQPGFTPSGKSCFVIMTLEDIYKSLNRQTDNE